MPSSDAVRAIELAREAGLAIATAESLTGGLVAARLTDVPGSSVAFVGGVVAYSAAAKESVLGVDPAVIAAAGVVSEPVALALADGVAGLLGAGAAVATTGVAGPGDHDGVPAGTVWIAAIGPRGRVARRHGFAGDRDSVRSQAADTAVSALCEVLDSRNIEGTWVG